MLSKNYSLVVIFFLLLPIYLIPQTADGSLIDCNLAYTTTSSKLINEYSAEDFYVLGLCEYQSNNYIKAYDHFISAKSLGFADKKVLHKFIAECRKKITNLSENELPILESNNQLEVNNYKHKVQVYLLNIIFIFIAISGLITSALLIFKHRTEKSNMFLGFFLIVTSLTLIELVFYWQDFFSYTPNVPIYRVLFFLIAPSLYLYLKTKHTETFPARKEIIFHYVPFFIVLLFLIVLYNLHDTNNMLLNGMDWAMNSNWVKAIHLSAYLVLIIADFEKINKHIARGFKNWMLTLIVFIAILTIFIVARATFEHIYVFDYISKYFIAVYLILFIVALEILMIIQPNIILDTIQIQEANKPKNKYKNSSLTANMTISVKAQVLDSLNIDKIYLDNTLTLTKLANKINVDRYSLSQVINQELKKNFYELINDHRIEEAVRIIKTKPTIQVVDLIYECGFNNKVSFYKAFKKRMHMTPKEFIEKKDK
ncbi:AraC family transcriptional regulator [Maribacter ulvicola]|uniref:Transcriptional regulator, AraC family n=1 Tax=Maribacter ulvicola TaxID=228959 RepID=A0A1N6S798_9FLAO|nr:helix-turn-helix domain-containing protein [Maribacter ulvicola]SIQ36877.1 transcriptional regulator, AraC family [Maribacter ulvicola]